MKAPTAELTALAMWVVHCARASRSEDINERHGASAGPTMVPFEVPGLQASEGPRRPTPRHNGTKAGWLSTNLKETATSSTEVEDRPAMNISAGVYWLGLT